MSVRGVLNREAGVHPAPGPLLVVPQSGGTDRCPGFCLSVRGRLGRLLAFAPAQVAGTPRSSRRRASLGRKRARVSVARCSQRRLIPIVRERRNSLSKTPCSRSAGFPGAEQRSPRIETILGIGDFSLIFCDYGLGCPGSHQRLGKKWANIGAIGIE